MAICTRNRAEFLRLCIDGLLLSMGDIDAPIVVVDNGSTDATADLLCAYGSKLLVLLESTAGLSRARNRALAACATDYIVYLDDDGIPDPSWAAAIAEVTRRGEADIFGGPYHPYYSTTRPAWYSDGLGSAHLDLAEGRQPEGVCLSGGNMGWRTDMLRDVGGFDVALGMQGNRLLLGEETALQLKLRELHPELRVDFVSGMRMLHHVAPEKMTLGYIHQRNYMYGWQLRDIDPSHDFNRMSFMTFARATKLGLPLLARLAFRDRARYPHWKSYAAQYLLLNSILLGVQARRLTGNRAQAS